MTNVANDPAVLGSTLPSGGREPLLGHGVPLAEVLRLPALAGARVLAGHAGLHRRVERMGVMETADVVPFVRAHELLLTTGYPLRDQPDALVGVIETLHAQQVAGLAVKLGSYLDGFPAEGLARADALGLPVVALPPEASFDDVLTQVLSSVLGRQAALLERSEEVHRGLVQVVLGGGGLPEVAAALAGALDLAVLVTTPDGRVVADAGDPADVERARTGPWCGADGRFLVESSAAAVGRHDDSTADRPAGHAVVPVVASGVDHGRIVAVSSRRALADADVHALERAAMVCALVVVKQLAVSAVEERYHADFLRDLLLGRAGPAERVVAHAASLGWRLDRPLVVVVAEPDPDTAPAAGSGSGSGSGSNGGTGLELRPTVERLATAWQTVVRPRDPQAAVCAFTTEVVAVLGEPADGDVERQVRELVAAVRGDGGGGRRPFTTGVSRVVRDVETVAAAYEQARTAVQVGRQVHGGAAVSHFDRLGVHRLLSLVPDAAELRGFLTETLGGLADDTAEAKDLRHTLEVLLDTNLNVAETARRLHFHYNTLRYRIAKLERLLGPFTTDAHLRLDLALALRVVQMRGIGR